MKRLNPKTGKPFKHGETRADGYRFIAYEKTNIKKNGFYAEQWLSNEKFESKKLREKLKKRTKYKNDKEYRESEKLRHRTKYNTDKEYREHKKLRDKLRYNTKYKNDKEFREHQNFLASKYRKENREVVNAINAKRRAARKQAGTKYFKDVYKDQVAIYYKFAKVLERLMGEQYHVDHAIPLQGKNVSGLHVPANLQIIPATANLRKGNKFE